MQVRWHAEMNVDKTNKSLKSPGAVQDNRLRAGVILNIAFIIAEVISGLFSNSVALLSDAGHNFSDVVTLIIAWGAIKLSQRRPTMKYTYGLRRSTILAALLNTLVLMVAVGVILWQAIDRLGRPVEVNSRNVIIVASVGILINGITAVLLRKGHKKDLNMQSAFLHFILDTLVSLGVVVTGVIIAFTHLYWIDSAVSVIILLIVIYTSYHLLVDSVNLALDAVPEGININEVMSYLRTLPEVTGLHDLHIWALGTTDTALTVHLSTRMPTGVDFIAEIQDTLRQEFGIGHATIQVEYGDKSGSCAGCN